MPTYREIKIDDLGGKKGKPGRMTTADKAASDKRELSDLVVGEKFHINSIVSDLKECSPKSQKRRAAERVMETVQKIDKLYTKDLEDAATIKKIEAQLKETKVWKALEQLRAARRQTKKAMHDLTNVYLGGVDMLKAIGIQLNGETVKTIQGILGRGD